MIELQHLTKRFATQGGTVVALNDINLTIRDGDVYGIIGMSGAGKSTLVRCINMLERPDEGNVIVNGKQMQDLRAADLRAARREITMIFQQFNLLMQRTCLRNIMFPMELAKVPGDKAEARARELLELVGLPDKADAYPAQLSGGQKQRIAIARALATDPKVLLCDEATSALDPNTTHAILQLIQKINRELGITVVIITHQMSVVEEVCNRVAILDNGTVVEEGEVQAIFSHPTSKAARRLVYPAGAPQAEVLPGHKLVRVAFGGTQTTDKPLVASLAIECGALVSIMAADTRIVNGQTLGSMLLALPDDDKAAAALEYIRNYPGITFEEVCNRVAILDNGTVVEEGEVQAIFSHPTSKAARRLVYPAGAPQAEVLPGHKLVRVAFGGTQTTDKPLVASLAIECGALVSIMAADTRIVNGQTLGSMLLALPDDDKAAAALEYIRNYPGITFEEVNG